MCDKITESQNLNEFWGSYYVPIYRYLFTHNQFEALTVRMVAGVQSADVQKLVKSHDKEIGNMGTKVADYLNEIGYQHTLDKTKRTDDIGTIFEDNVPVAKGKLVNNDKKICRANGLSLMVLATHYILIITEMVLCKASPNPTITQAY